MITVFPAENALHNPPQEFIDGALVPVFESPQRAAIILEALRQAGMGPVVPPRAFGMGPVLAVHDAAYLGYLEHAYARWVDAGGAPAAVLPSTLAVRWMSRPCLHPLAAPGYYAFDLSAPIVAGTFRAALASAEAALTGAALLLEGRRAAYALCRPPGHHAGSDMCGGYCYLNNAAIAAQYLLDQASGLPTPQHPAPSTQHPRRAAVLDIDFHHGNGTQQIFYRRSDVLFVSVHADPAHHYPHFLGYADERGEGDGLGFNLNLPLPPGTGDAPFLAALDEGLAAIRSFAPTLFVQEGGYGIAALGQNVVGLLGGFAAG
jgi:acetoin utilization deacetylase AcuC-like enzyme